MILENPYALWLLLLLPLLFWRSRKPAVRFSSVRLAKNLPISWRQRLVPLPKILRVGAFLLLIVAMARPQRIMDEVEEKAHGIAIYAVIDRSSSMKEEMIYGKERLSRLAAVKRVFLEFLEGNGKELGGRKHDLVGLIAFARYAHTIAPLTLSKGAIRTFLSRLTIVQKEGEDGTAIGDALALGAARLQSATEMAPSSKKNKILILLTDGENNCGKRTPEEAVNIAKDWGIKIYVIAIAGGKSSLVVSTPMGEAKIPVAAPLDERFWKNLAESTGGIYRNVQDINALRSVYEEIDRLEKTEITTLRFRNHEERFGPFALLAFICLLLSLFLASTLGRNIP